MSVITTLRAKADPDAVEAYAASNPEVFQQAGALAREHCVIAHRFYGGNGDVMVIDEWPNEESFQAFWEAAGSIVGPMMAAIGAGEPTVEFWNRLETHDEIGWD